MAQTRAIAYVRLSRLTDESTSVERQREVVAAACLARGWELIAIEEDVDVSATTKRLNRPGLTRARDAIKRGEADVLLAWRLDRVCRSVGDFVTLLDEGVDVASATEPVDSSTPMGRAMMQVLQVFAELESKTTGLRIKDARGYLDKVGRWHGGVIPFGYRETPHPDGVGKALAIDDEAAATVRRMAASVLEGHSTYQVAKTLNADGVRSPKGGEWNPTIIRRLLTSDAISGRTVKHTRTKAGTITATHLLRDDAGQPLQHWPAVLDPDEVARLRVALTRGRAKSTPGTGTSARWLSGVARCGGCGRPLTVRTRNTGAKKSVYTCPRSMRGQSCDVRAVIECWRLEGEVEERFLRIAGPFVVSEWAEEVVDNADELADVTREIGEVGSALTGDDADMPTLLQRLAELKRRRATLEALAPAPELRQTGTPGETIAERWPTADDTWRQRTLKGFAVDVSVGPAQRGRWQPERVSMLVGDVEIGPEDAVDAG